MLFAGSGGLLSQNNSNLFWDNVNNRLGIGTTSPYSLLSISNSVSTTANTPLFTIASTTAGTATSTLLTVLANGNVGIGTASPGAYKLNVSGALNATSLALSGGNSIAWGNTTIVGATGSYLNLTTSGTSRIYITTAGNVGIGTTTPYSLLTLYKAGSTAADSPQLVLSASSTVSGLGDFLNNWAIGTDIADGGKFKIASSSVIGTNDRFVIDGSGNVGIGTTSPRFKLSVESSSEGNTLQIYDTDGNCRQDPDAGGITTTCSSDIRLKTDISETAPVLDYFLGIPIKDYTVIASGDRMTGVIAQELLENYPELVVMGEDGYYGVKELRSWQFIKAIQELDAKISAGAISGGFWFSNSAGIITTNNILDLSGQGIINTGYIASANWKIKEDGTIEAKKVVADRIEVKKPFGITIYDTVTNLPVCLISEAGVLRSLQGNCESNDSD